MSHNPYVDQLISQGYDRQDARTAPARSRVFPCVIGGRKFETEEQYLEELHEFLNSI